MVKDWLRATLESELAQEAGEDFGEWSFAMNQAVMYLETTYAIPPTREICAGGRVAEAKRVLRITDRIDEVREDLLKKLEQ
jgi:hypothetical protein